jgi:hypothetical protein
MMSVDEYLHTNNLSLYKDANGMIQSRSGAVIGADNNPFPPGTRLSQLDGGIINNREIEATVYVRA